jgi:nucleotide sugar dehydrogenase
MRITVVGLGKIGLPLAVQFATKGHQVVGADINRATVDLVNSGCEPFPGEAQLQDRLAGAIASAGLSATTDTTSAVAQSEAVVVVVPLFVDEAANPDFAAMDAATRAVGAGLKAGTLVSYETTLPVGVTRSRLVPILESESGLSCGEDFFVVFSPERVYSGRVFADLRRYPKLVGGIDDASTARGVAFYESVLDFDPRPDLARPNGVWDLGTCEAAELAKLAETTYRDVNIGLANQFARFAAVTGIDVYQVIEACNSQPFSHLHQPGIAVGGHCIPVYPRMYLWSDPSATVVRAARETNSAMPTYAVEQLVDAMGALDGETVVVLGAAYRGGVKETAFSGVFRVVEELRRRHAHALVHDPHYTSAELESLGFEVFALGSHADAVMVQTDHPEFRAYGSGDFPGVQAVLDGRRVLDPQLWDVRTFMVLGTPTSGVAGLALPSEPDASREPSEGHR